MEEKKRKVVTYHSTKSDKKLERELNKGYRIEFCHPLRSYLVMILVKEETLETDESFIGEAERNRNIADFVTLDASDDAEKKRLFDEGYKVYKLTTKTCVMVKYESEKNEQKKV